MTDRDAKRIARAVLDELLRLARSGVILTGAEESAARKEESCGAEQTGPGFSGRTDTEVVGESSWSKREARELIASTRRKQRPVPSSRQRKTS